MGDGATGRAVGSAVDVADAIAVVDVAVAVWWTFVGAGVAVRVGIGGRVAVAVGKGCGVVVGGGGVDSGNAVGASVLHARFRHNSPSRQNRDKRAHIVNFLMEARRGL